MAPITLSVLQMQRKRSVPRLISNATFALCFFPSVINFLIDSQTQPTAGIVALSFIALCGIRLSRSNVLLLSLIAIVAGYGLASIVLFPANAANVVIQGTSYLLPLVVFLGMGGNCKLISVKLFWMILIAWILMGISQATDALGGAVAFMEPIFKLIISERFTLNSDVEGRGVAFFSHEPGDASAVIALFLCTAIYFYASEKISRREFFGALVAIAFLGILNRSGTLFAVGALCIGGSALAMAYRGLKLQTAINMCFIGILGLGTLLLLGDVLPSQGVEARALGVARNTVELIDSQKIEILPAMVAIGGLRPILLYVGYGSLSHNYGLGHGIATWKIDEEAQKVLQHLDIRFADYQLAAHDLASLEEGDITKPHSYAAVIAYDTGLLGVTVLFLFFISMILVRVPNRHRWAKGAIIFYAVGWLCLLPLIPLTAPWLALSFLNDLRLSPNMPGPVQNSDVGLPNNLN